MSVPFLKKDSLTIRTEMRAVLNAMGIGALYEAGKAKAIMDGVADKLADLYDSTYSAILNSNPSTAQEVWLDMVANSIAVTRFLAEGDESLRARVALNMASQQMCNEVAIDVRIRLHPRVNDVSYIDYVYGSGSFVAVVQSLEGTMVDRELITELTALLNGVVAKGTKYIIMAPEVRRVRMVVSVRGDNVSTAVVQSSISSYLNGLGIGSPMLIDHVRAAAVSGGADHVDFHEIYVDDQRVLPRDFPVEWDEKLEVDTSLDVPILVAA